MVACSLLPGFFHSLCLQELEKQLLVNALAKAKKAEATVQQEKLQVSS